MRGAHASTGSEVHVPGLELAFMSIVSLWRLAVSSGRSSPYMPDMMHRWSWAHSMSSMSSSSALRAPERA